MHNLTTRHCGACDRGLRSDDTVCPACGAATPMPNDANQIALFDAPPPPLGVRGSADVPGFIARALHPRHTPRWRAVAALLALSLAVQLIYVERDTLAQDARWRPWIERLCAFSGCTLSPWREPAAFAIIERSVQPNPDVPGVLHIRATFRNRAPFAQAWPQLELRLLDINGAATGARRFSADEYLGTAPDSATVAPDQSVNARLDVLDPGRNTLSFEFSFH